jgi:hypothetical protein
LVKFYDKDLDKPFISKVRVSLLCDNDVIEKLNLQKLATLFNLLRQFNILVTGCQISRRMIVRQNYCAGSGLEGSGKDDLWINDCSTDSSD